MQKDVCGYPAAARTSLALLESARDRIVSSVFLKSEVPMTRTAFLLAASLLALSACSGANDEAAANAMKMKQDAEQAAAMSSQLLKDPEAVVGSVASEVGLTTAPAVGSIDQAARAAVETAGRNNRDAAKALACTTARMEQDTAGMAANC
jgi:hypothetical protein